MNKVVSVLLLVLMLASVKFGSVTTASVSENTSPVTKTSTSVVTPNMINLISSIPKELLLKEPANQLTTICAAVWKGQQSICSAKILLDFTITSNLAIKATNRANSLRLSDQLTESTNRIKAGSTSKTLGQNDAELLIINPLVKDLDIFNFTKYQADIDKCWNYMNHVRGVALCYACQSGNEKYFSQDKAIVSQTDCNNMLGSCLPFFRDTIDALQAVQKISQSNIRSNWNSDTILVHLDQLTTQMKNSELDIIISKYDAIIKSNKKHDFANQICLMLFRLYSDPIFGIIGQLADGFTQILGGSSGSRKLFGNSNTLSSSSLNPFSGDVAILQNIPNNGAQSILFSDSTSSPLGSNQTAMNLSLAFP